MNDLFSPEPEEKGRRLVEEAQDSPSQNKLSTIFLVVLGIHVAAILGITGYYLMTGNDEQPGKNQITDEASLEEAFAETTLSSGSDVKPSVSASHIDRPSSSIRDLGVMVEFPGQTKGTSNQPLALNNVSQHQQSLKSDNVPQNTTYIVKSGDSLYKIARAHGMTVRELREMNQLSGDLIRPGDRLQVRGSLNLSASRDMVAAGRQAVNRTSTTSETVKPVRARTVQMNPGPNRYIVRKGDSLWAIAKRYGTTVDALKQLNTITDPTRLRVGTELILPTSTIPQQSASDGANSEEQVPVYRPKQPVIDLALREPVRE